MFIYTSEDGKILKAKSIEPNFFDKSIISYTETYLADSTDRSGVFVITSLNEVAEKFAESYFRASGIQLKVKALVIVDWE